MRVLDHINALSGCRGYSYSELPRALQPHKFFTNLTDGVTVFSAYRALARAHREPGLSHSHDDVFAAQVFNA